MKDSEISCVEVQVFGRVQGVFFRASTQKVATDLGLSGWVRNRSDGSVQIQAKGESARIQKLIQWCRSGGPERARVDDCLVKELDLTEMSSDLGFEVV